MFRDVASKSGKHEDDPVLREGKRNPDIDQAQNTSKNSSVGAKSSSSEFRLELENSEVIEGLESEVNHPRSDYVASPVTTDVLR